MMVFNDFIDDLDDFEDNIDELRERVDGVGDDAARETANDFQRDVKGTIQRKGLIDSGELYRSIKVRKVSPGTYMVYSKAEHAPYIEYGTKGPVEAENSEYLRFEDENGETIFRKSVSGIEAQPFWRPNENAYRVSGHLGNAFEEQLEEAIEEVFR